MMEVMVTTGSERHANCKAALKSSPTTNQRWSSVKFSGSTVAGTEMTTVNF